MSQYLGKILAVLLWLSLATAAPAHAVLTKLVFQGSITSISEPYAPPGVNLGDEVVGELVYDPATIDEQPLTWIGYYPDAAKTFTLVIGGSNFLMMAPPDTSEIDVINDDLVLGKYYDKILFRVAVLDESYQEARLFQLTFAQAADVPPTILTSDALGAQPIDINQFESKTGFMTYLPPGASQGNDITLTSVHLYPVNRNSCGKIIPMLKLLLD